MAKPGQGATSTDGFTVREAAERIGVTPEAVRRYIRERRLKATKKRSVGLKTIWVIDPKDLEDFLK